MCNGEAYEGGWKWYEYPTPDIDARVHRRAAHARRRGAGQEGRRRAAAADRGARPVGLDVPYVALLVPGLYRPRCDRDRGPASSGRRSWLLARPLPQIAYRARPRRQCSPTACCRPASGSSCPTSSRRRRTGSSPCGAFRRTATAGPASRSPAPCGSSTCCTGSIDSRDPLASHHQTGYIHCWFPPHFEGGSPLVDFDKLQGHLRRRRSANPAILEPGFAHLDAKTRVTKWFDDRAQAQGLAATVRLGLPPGPARLRLGGRSSKRPTTTTATSTPRRPCWPRSPASTSHRPTSTSPASASATSTARSRCATTSRSRAVDATAEWVFEYPEKSDGTRARQGALRRDPRHLLRDPRLGPDQRLADAGASWRSWGSPTSPTTRALERTRASCPDQGVTMSDLRLHGQASLRRPRRAA